jgi:RNA recognition motif-containing protein
MSFITPQNRNRVLYVGTINLTLLINLYIIELASNQDVIDRIYLFRIILLCQSVGSSSHSYLAFNSTGGIADEVTDDLLRAAFIPFGDITEVMVPVDFRSGKRES